MTAYMEDVINTVVKIIDLYEDTTGVPLPLTEEDILFDKIKAMLETLADKPDYRSYN